MPSRWVRCAVATLCLLPTVVMGQAEQSYDQARVAWDRGDYPVALRLFERLLQGPDAQRYMERIALLTGELYRTTELTTDGRAVTISLTGRWIAFERGSGPQETVIVSTATLQRRDSLAGASIAFDDAHGLVAVVRIAESPAIAAARADSLRLAVEGDQQTRAAASRRLRDLQQRAMRLVIRDLATGAERAAGDSTLAIANPEFSTDGRAVYFIGKKLGESGTHLWELGVADLALRRLTTFDAQRADLQVLPGGRSLLYVLGRDPFAAGRGGGGGGGGGGAATADDADSTAAGGRGAGGGGGRGGGPGGGIRGFVVRDIATGNERTISGTAPTVSADGETVAFLERRGADTLVNVLRVSGSGEAVSVRRSRGRVDAPAVSPDGKLVAYQLMGREDWELYVGDAEGKGDRRITHEIQHDILPRWVSATTLLGAIGEARHRRSYLYDVATGARTRLFHNNTVRTVAPEYEWVVSPDGSKVAIIAERDGDTVSLERGVYVVDLQSKVTTADVLARVRAQLGSELALRAEAKRRFSVAGATIRPYTEAVSKDRIYEYARSLFNFDSKHVTRPGNAKAIAYLDSVYRSFGYTPTLQWFEPRNAPRTANVVAVLKGTVSPDVVYVVGSHFDSRAEGPGADDNTSGTTMLLETARVLAKHPLPATVIFASFTGEEAGLLGSREFVRRARADSLRLVGAMNNDMMGWSNDERLDNTIRYSNPGIRDIQHGAALEFSRLITYDALYYKSTDAAAFYEAYGDIVGGFGSYPILGNPHYHQSHDVLETINFEQMAENTKANVATVMMLAMAPSRLTGLDATRTATGATLKWNPSPEKDVRSYLVQWKDRTGAERTMRVTAPRATIASVPAGATVMVKAVNARGLDGWDWARKVVP